MAEQSKQTRVGEICYVVHGGAIRQGIITCALNGFRTAGVRILSSLTGEEIGEIVTFYAHETIDDAIKEAMHQRDTLDASIQEWEEKTRQRKADALYYSGGD